MSEHELWNELGNLYFISGTYSQAVYAYNRSIQLDSGFGRPFCNLALTYVKQGKYSDAVRLYQRSIELLVDDREKAVTWYRLGDVYRHLKDYRERDPRLPAGGSARSRAQSGPEGIRSDPVRQPGGVEADGSHGSAPALAEVKAVPVTADQEIQTAVASGEEPAEAEGLRRCRMSPGRCCRAGIPAGEPTGFAQDEPILVEQPVVETTPIAEDTETQVPLLVENLPLDEMDAPDGQVEAVAALQEPLAEEAAPLLIESAPVTVEAGENPLVETHWVTLEEPVHEVVVPPEEEVLPVAATMPETSIEKPRRDR
jgi:hypothetical protein